MAANKTGLLGHEKALIALRFDNVRNLASLIITPYLYVM